MARTAGYAVAESEVPPAFVQSRIGTTGARYALDSLLMPRTDEGLTNIDYRSGVMASGDGGDTHLAMQVTAGAGAMQITVSQGNAVINTPQQAAYLCCWDTTQSLTLDPSSTSTDRIDRVIARVYDDYNTALSGGDADVRKFTVEVWKGTPVTAGGDPVPPMITTGGYIDLAFVTIAAGTGTITDSMIEDRRGIGIVARGGMRTLYGPNARTDSDDFQAPGAYPGEQRWVHTNKFQHQVYYGANADDGRSGWRGVHNCLVYNANPSTKRVNWITGWGSSATVCTVTIPWPGTEFVIYPTGRLFATLSPDTSMDARITVNDIWGDAVNWQNAHAYGAGDDTQITVNVPPVMYGPFQSKITVVLSGYTLDCRDWDWGWSYGGKKTTTLLSVCVYPSTVQPPNESPPGTPDGSGDDIADLNVYAPLDD